MFKMIIFDLVSCAINYSLSFLSYHDFINFYKMVRPEFFLTIAKDDMPIILHDDDLKITFKTIHELYKRFIYIKSYTFMYSSHGIYLYKPTFRPIIITTDLLTPIIKHVTNIGIWFDFNAEYNVIRSFEESINYDNLKVIRLYNDNMITFEESKIPYCVENRMVKNMCIYNFYKKAILKNKIEEIYIKQGYFTRWNDCIFNAHHIRKTLHSINKMKSLKKLSINFGMTTYVGLNQNAHGELIYSNFYDSLWSVNYISGLTNLMELEILNFYIKNNDIENFISIFKHLKKFILTSIESNKNITNNIVLPPIGSICPNLEYLFLDISLNFICNDNDIFDMIKSFKDHNKISTIGFSYSKFNINLDILNVINMLNVKTFTTMLPSYRGRKLIIKNKHDKIRFYLPDGLLPTIESRKFQLMHKDMFVKKPKF